ncbi:MAG: serine/threonine-protein kinase [Acidobacteriota bacterium]
MQHILARYSATALGLAPFFFLVAFLFQQRHRTIVQLFSGSQATVLFVATGLGLLFLRFRGPILDVIDRRFFRERYNARVVLTQLAEQVRGTRNLHELSNMVGQGVDLALHLEKVSLLAQDPSVGKLVDPFDQVRPLDAASPLATLLQGHPEPLEVDLDSPSSPLQSLKDEEKHWLIDAQIEMLAPAYALDGSMIGMLALGPKKSELPFLREDRDLLKSVCSATGLVIELLFLKEQTPVPRSRGSRGSRGSVDLAEGEQTDYPLDQIVETSDAAMECLGCSRVYPPDQEKCPRCTVDLSPTLVPYVLGSQYRIEERLGEGGMAIVYRATDLRLGRSVAIKTLPRVSPEAAMRLHREARTAATVTHPGLAAIYGLETWQGVPMLILELLPGGTLADQLMAGEPLDPLLAIDMGMSVALALQKIHSAGILHRDIKPSNIGYTDEGFAKLLDFGVARLQYDLRQEPVAEAQGDAAGSHSRIMNTASWVIGRTATGQLVGTFGYLSPEAVRGFRPEPTFDTWALSVVLWESLTGENLFADRMVQRTLDRIRDVKVKDIRKALPECPAPVVDFFKAELHPDRGKRAQSGEEMHARLEALRRELVS